VPAASTATISAEAQLRDFKKESTAFVPASLQRRRGGIDGAGTGRGTGNVDSAPVLNGECPSDSDDKDLKRRAGHYLNNPGSYADERRKWHRRSGGRRVLILLEIDDAM